MNKLTLIQQKESAKRRKVFIPEEIEELKREWGRSGGILFRGEVINKYF